MVVQSAFVTVAHRIVWCTVATVDRRNRPRSRVLHPYWERDGDTLTGWITTRPTPLKLAHVDHSPYASCSYWDATHDVAVAECHAEWVADVAVKEHAWELFRKAGGRSATTPTRSGRTGRRIPTPACSAWSRGG